MKTSLMTTNEASHRIDQGAVLVVAGAEELLAKLPQGNWCGGTTAYFMTDSGGIVGSDRLLCSEIEESSGSHTAVMEPDQLERITAGRYESGFTYLLLPAFSEAHSRYALEAAGYYGLFDQPIMGWVAGVNTADIGKRTPRVFDGRTGRSYENAGLALHVALPSSLMAEVDIINPFVPGDGPSIVFPETSFAVGVCTVDGEHRNFADYIAQNGIDTRLPLVANYAGAIINVSINAVDERRGEVTLYAPVVAGETYRIARNVPDYAGAFTGDDTSLRATSVLTCNCILNYLYAGLEGKKTGRFVGPITFGEIAYILLNQTLVVLGCRQGDDQT